MNLPAPAVGPTRLRDRLRRYTPQQAALRARLFGNGDALAGGGEPPLLWRFAAAPGLLPPALMLGAGDHEFCLSLVQDGLREALGEREWWDYHGPSRLLAWSLAHERLLGGLQRLFGVPPLALRWAAEQALPERPLLLAFSVAAEGEAGAAGVLALPQALAETLAGHDGWRRAPAAAWHSLPAPLRIELAGFSFPLHELRDSGSGDVLVLGPRNLAWRRLQLRAERTAQRWPALYDGVNSCSVAAPGALRTPDTMEDWQMTQQATQAAAGGGALEAVPVQLDFELGQLSLSLAELAALQPGYVFQLGGRLEDARVVVRANGARIGHGELVAVGEVLGVQLTAIDPHGFR